MSNLTRISFLACALFSSPVAADQFDNLRIPCNSTELQALSVAIANANKMAADASATLPPRNSTEGLRFKKWFGGPEGDYDPTVKAVYDEMAVKLIFQKFWCLPPNSQTPEDLFHTNAFIPRGSVGEIFVTSNFFQLPATGPMSQGGTVVHEVSHQSQARRVVDDDITGDGKNDYGSTVAKDRAKLSIVKARSNADNFKYYAEDIMYGVP